MARNRHQEQGSADSPAVRLLEALRRGDDAAALALCGEATIVSAENMGWSLCGRDEIEAALARARDRFPGLTFESRTRHAGFGLVIEEARVRDVQPESDETDENDETDQHVDGDARELAAVPADLGARRVSVAADDADGETLVHPMWDEPSSERHSALSVWRDRGDDGMPPAPLNMPVRVTVRHDDLQVHEVTLSFPAALLKRALGLHVDPLEMSLSEVQSAFIAPVGAGFTTHSLTRPELTLVPPPPVEQPAPAPAPADDEPPRRRRRRGKVLLPILVVVAALLLGGGYWAVHAKDTSAAAGPPVPHRTPAPSPSASPAPSPSPSAAVSTSPSASVSPSTEPTRKPNVTLRSDLAFSSNSAALSAKARTAIAGVAHQVIRARLHGTIYVDGYTDNQGSNDGLVLSQHRADAVAGILRRDLAKEDIKVVATGHGESDPVASNATAAGRAQNRRVTITLPKP